jgi:hypothetical protein
MTVMHAALPLYGRYTCFRTDFVLQLPARDDLSKQQDHTKQQCSRRVVSRVSAAAEFATLAHGASFSVWSLLVCLRSHSRHGRDDNVCTVVVKHKHIPPSLSPAPHPSQYLAALSPDSRTILSPLLYVRLCSHHSGVSQCPAMSTTPPSFFEQADVFHLFDVDTNAATSSPAATLGGNTTMTEAQYAALVRMVAANLGLSCEDAERLFPSCRVGNDGCGKSGSAADDAVREPPLCAHLSREGVELYWSSSSSASAIPDVRCCDARDMDKREPFPATGHGPHVHCLYCFHNALESAPPAGRGVPPPVVEDFRDAASLQAHQHAHRSQYLAYLQLLEDGNTSSHCELDVDVQSEEGRAACECAAEEEGRHGCYMAAMGTAACPIVTFYCAACDTFAPPVHLRPSDVAEGTPLSWVSTEELNVVLCRLLLSCHLLHMMGLLPFSRGVKGDGDGAAAQTAQPRHLIYLFKPILFHEGVEEALVEQFEEGAEYTYTAVVLPSASVAGVPAELLILELPPEEAGGGTLENPLMSGSTTTPFSSQTYSPAVIGFAMEWATEELLQSKLDLVLQQHQLGTHASPDVIVSPFHVTTRWVYVEDTQEWVQARVLYHRAVTTRADLPSSYEDSGDEGIRVVERYAIDAPMPAYSKLTGVATAATSMSSSPREIKWSPSIAMEEDTGEDPLAPDGCPYSMESRTIDFLARMTALAKAMHEMAAWRLSIDENKQNPP